MEKTKFKVKKARIKILMIKMSIKMKIIMN